MNEIINDDFRNHLGKFTQDAFIFSDPPYNQKYHYEQYKDNLESSEYENLLWSAFSDKKSIIILYPEPTINILPKILHDCEETVSWVYNSNTAKQHRLITWWNCKPDFKKGEGQLYKNPTDKRIAKRIQEGKKCRFYDWWEINQVKNVSKKNNPHSCPIPYELAKRVIEISTKKGDLIIDPFAGSGTILKAAKDMGRRYLGFEIDEKYYNYAKNLLK
jgi:site-specific DNA-methyltransferase (adenine-specific)